MRTPTRTCLLTQILSLLCAASLGLAGEPGIDCNCGQTGYYVAPAAPEQAAMTDGPTDMVGFSPNAYYMLTVSGGLLSIYSADTEAAVLTLSVQGVGAWWGFSPDDSKFLHYDGSQIRLYNLDAAHPETPLMSLALDPDTQAFAGFSPHGKYLFCSSVYARMSVTVSLWDAETGQPSLQDQFTPGTIIEEDDTALSSWGFSPDENDRCFFYIWAGPAGSYWRLANLKSGTVIAQNTVPTLSLLTAAEFGFSPCGDLFGATVHQDMLPGSQDSSTSVTLYRTSDGSIPTGSSLWLARGAEIELEAQPEWQVAHIDYTVNGLLCANSAGSSCPEGTFLADLALNPSSAVGTQPVSGTVRFNQPAAGTVTISVTNAGNGTSYVLPTSQPLTVSGEIQKGFTLFPQSSVTVATPVTVTASFNGSAVSGVLVLSPPDTVTVRSLSLSAPSIVGGGKLVGTVTLSGTAPPNGATVLLGSGGSSVVSIPASLVIPAGATTGTFSILTKPVDFTYGIVITAARNSGFAQTNLIVQAPPPPTLRSFTLSPGQVVSGNYVTAMLRLSGPAPLYGVVMLLPTSSTPARQTETFTASLSGSADLEASVEVLPAGSLETLTLEKTTVHSCADLYAGLGGVWGRVSLNGWLAPSGEGGEPVTVHLGTDHPGLVQFRLPFAEGGDVISNIVIMPGQREASFFLKMSPVLDDTSIQITASLGGVTRSVTLADRVCFQSRCGKFERPGLGGGVFSHCDSRCPVVQQ
ncbi:MAG: hypothetical protein NTW03_07400 [Verrucomicrobia bacterium]|nr:hypothetical protein [Verrucomicrobiota bacterium]